MCVYAFRAYEKPDDEPFDDVAELCGPPWSPRDLPVVDGADAAAVGYCDIRVAVVPRRARHRSLAHPAAHGARSEYPTHSSYDSSYD